VPNGGNAILAIQKLINCGEKFLRNISVVLSLSVFLFSLMSVLFAHSTPDEKEYLTS